MNKLKYIFLKSYIILRFIIRKLREFLSFTNKYQQSYNFLKEITDIYSLKPVSGRLRDIQLDSLNFAKELRDILEKNNITPILGYGSLLGAYRHKGFIPWDDDIDFDLIREDYNKLIQLAKNQYIYLERPMNRYWTPSRILKFEDSLIKNNPNKLIFIRTNRMIQVYKGTSLKDFVHCDFFVLDFYSDTYDYKTHLAYTKELKKQLEMINNFPREITFIDTERTNNPNITSDGNNLLYGIDSDPTYTSAMNYGEWLKRDDLYPLQKMQFEDTEFYIPQNPIKFLEHRYGNWEKLPKFIGELQHQKYIDEYNKRQSK